MTKSEAQASNKFDYRYQFLRDFQKTLLAVSTAIPVAAIAYVADLDSSRSTNLVVVALFAFAISIALQVVSSFLIFLGTGYLYDEDFRLLKIVGNALTALLVLGIGLFIVG